MGTTKQQIHKLRHGERKLTVQWAKRLAPVLGCSWQELIEGPAPQDDLGRASLLAVYNSLDQRDRETLLRIAGACAARSANRSEPAPVTHPKRRASACIVPATRIIRGLERN